MLPLMFQGAILTSRIRRTRDKKSIGVFLGDNFPLGHLMDVKKLAIFGSILLSFPPFIEGQKLKVDLGQRYMLLATTKTSTMQKELNEAAKQGFVVQMGSHTSGSEVALFLERAAKPPDTFKYQLLATTRTNTMQKELNYFSQLGFRLLPRTVIPKKRVLGGFEILAILEAPPKIEKRYQYKLLATSRTSTLQREVTQVQAEGYVLVAMVSRNEHIVILEKEVPINQ